MKHLPQPKFIIAILKGSPSLELTYVICCADTTMSMVQPLQLSFVALWHHLVDSFLVMTLVLLAELPLCKSMHFSNCTSHFAATSSDVNL